MSDDVFDAFGGDDIFAEEEEQQQPEGEGQNRTFIIAVAVMGGLLLCALVSFGVWALVLNKPRQAAPPPSEISSAVTVEAVSEEGDVADAPTETAAPTEAPEPTATPLLGPTATPAEDDAGSGEATEGEAGGEEAEPTATRPPRRTATPTSTPRPTATPRPSTGESGTSYGSGSTTELSQTGLGEWLLVGGAALLVAVMVLARRLRATT